MQKSFIAITLALTLTSTLAYYNAIQTGYSKAPVPASADNDTNYTNANFISLISSTTGELDLLGTNQTATTTTTSNWNAVYRKLDGKTLSASTNSSVTLSGALLGAYTASYINGYAITFGSEPDGSNIPQISVYQTPLNGGAALGRIFVTSNTNVNFTPTFLKVAAISKTVYVFWNASATANGTLTQVNVTNFAVGGAKGTQDFNITTGYTGGLNVVWGEALGSNQIFANWIEGGVLKDATIDVSKGTVTPNVVNGWTVNFTCTVYSTDKKLFGDLCFDAKTNPGNTTFYARTNTNTSLVRLVTNTSITNNWVSVYPYGPYIAIAYSDYNISTVGNTTYSFDIWNLDSFTQYRNRTNFLTIDTSSRSQIFRVPSGGLYTLLYNPNVNISGVVYNFSSIQVGLVLGSSYLTSVLGFILTIVAGLLLF
jgi:hypothetical protein